jgi:glycosyltransferase involved in cell wall biosynthesis
MRVLLDALGSTAQSGGMRLHSTEVIRAWLQRHPEDDLHVIGPRWISKEFEGSPVTVHHWSNESVALRAPGQLLASARIARQIKADAVISLSPIVTPFAGKRPRIAFQHDWRHLKNPREFPFHQRLYRSLWVGSARWATVNACISTKAQTETSRFARNSRTVLVPNGVDHAGRWEPSSDRNGDEPYAVTFGHHNNKRPELLIRALPLTRRRGRGLRLVVLGAQGAYQDELRELSKVVGVGDRVDFPGFVSESSYQTLVSHASLIALVSSDEGFGLPIAEAWWLGIPALVATDSDVAHIFDGYPTEADQTPAGIADGIDAALNSDKDPSGSQTAPTWADTVTKLRNTVTDCRTNISLS